MKKPLDKELVTEVGIDTGSNVAGASIGLIAAGPVGAIVGAVVSPVAAAVLKRVLTKKEKDRVEKVYKLSISKIHENISAGKPLRNDIDRERLKELTEGTLLKAKDTYEEKKLPFIANLLANAAFTNTPVSNLNQTLIYAEQLSFRQLTIVSVIGRNINNEFNLSKDPLMSKDKKLQIDENSMGVYSDINHLMALGILGQELSAGAGPAIPSGVLLISPALLISLYPAILLHSSMVLDYIDQKDTDEIISILKL